MAKKAEVIARVLSPFRDKYTGEIRKRGSVFPADEKRVKEINAGRTKPLVEITEAKDAESAQTAATAPAVQPEQNDAGGEKSPPVASSEPEEGATAADGSAGGVQAGEPASAPDTAKPDTKGKDKGK